MTNYGKKIVIIIGLLVTIVPNITSARFDDVDVTHPHFQAIEYLSKTNVIKGYDLGGKMFFKALQKVSRAEAIKMIILASEQELSNQPATFSDVAKDAWYANYIGTAEEKRLVKGFADGNFHPQAQVTRAEFLSMAFKAFDIPDLSQLADTAEGKQWYTPYFEFGKDFRIIDDKTLSPHESLTRGDVAEIIFRLKMVKEKDFTWPYVYSGAGSASYYNEGFAGKLTASGEVYDPFAMTAAHRTLPFGTKLRVWHEDKSVIVTINDRGPYHSSRILDLSEKAFARLAPISRGVVEVRFEVYSGGDEEVSVDIPVDVQGEIASVQAFKSPLPDEVKAVLGKSHKDIANESDDLPEVESITSQAIFVDSVAHMPPDFFDGVTLRSNIPQTFVTGTFRHISGITDELGHEKATIFLQPTSFTDPAKLNQQISFSAPVNDRNFVIPVSFLEPGTYQMGLVLDSNHNSKVVDIEVKSPETMRNFSYTPTEYPEEFDLNLVPEDKTAVFSWPSDPDRRRVTKIDIAANGSNRKQTLYVEDGINRIEVPYSFFTQFKKFAAVDVPLSIDVFAAESKDETINAQTSNWQKVGFGNFDLIAGFHDSESNKVAVHNFERFPGAVESVGINGRILDNDVVLRDMAFVTHVGGDISEVPLVFSGNNIAARVHTDEPGTYIFEIVSDQGEILFNRALYVYEDKVLPVLEWERVKPSSENLVGVRYWINKFRQKRGLVNINSDSELTLIAQDYADKMAADRFVGHTSPTGVTFEDRIRQAGLMGEFAENVAFGSNFQLALDGVQESASHFRNVINYRWTRVGIGLAENTDGVYMVQIFGR